MNIGSSFSFLHLPGIVSRVKNNIGILFVAALLFLLAFEAMSIKNTVDLVLTSQTAGETVVKSSQGVRVNFAGYDKAVQRLQVGVGYEATTTPDLPNPFFVPGQK